MHSATNQLFQHSREAATMKTPIIKCFPRPGFNGGLMFYCPFCQKWHLHGIGNGHRVAHCTNQESPLKENGYILKMLTKAELREIAEAINIYLKTKKDRQQ